MAFTLVVGLVAGLTHPFSQTSHAAESDSEPNTWIIETVDDSGDVGAYSSLAFSASGLPSISYQDASNYDLKFAQWNGSEWMIQTADSIGYAGFETALAFSPTGNPAIGYVACSSYSGYGSNGAELRFAYYNGLVWEVQTVDSNIGDFIRDVDLGFDSSGAPGISYFTTDDALKYAHLLGTSWHVDIVRSKVPAPGTLSLAFDSTGNPAISFNNYDYGGESGLHYALYDGSSWTHETVDDYHFQNGGGNSLAFDSKGNPAISYGGGEYIKYAYREGAQWTVSTASGVGSSIGTSLSFDLRGNPCIAYSTYVDLKVAWFNGESWGTETVDHEDNPEPRFCSLAFDSVGNPAVSYYRSSIHRDLRFAYDRGVKADFCAESSVGIIEGGTVRFSDLSIGAILSWKWDFGDGTPAIEWTAETRPFDGKVSHTYTAKGKYTVSLTASGEKGNHAATKANFVSVYEAEGVEAWAVIIGVSDYQNDDYDLQYPANDALNLYNRVSPIFGQDHTRLLRDSDASKANIESAMSDWLAPKEGSEDIVLVFFSGHGGSFFSRFLLCPYDSLEGGPANDISYSLFDSWLDALDSERVVVVLDSCKSGAYASRLAEPGRVILAASSGSESAWGFADLDSGVFSYYLLECLGQTSLVDTNADRKISAEEMFKDAEPKVVSYTTEHADVQHPQLFDGFAGELDLFSLATITCNVNHDSMTLSIDGAEASAIGPGASCLWLVDSSHVLSVPAVVQDGDGSRYVFSCWSDGNTSASRTVTASQATALTANYTRQYYLTVATGRGTAGGEGWYDEGSEAEISVAGGSTWSWAFGGWTGDSTDESRIATVMMDAPKVVTATWKPSLMVWLLGVCGGGLCLIVVAILGLMALRRMRSRQPVVESQATASVTTNSDRDD